MGPEGDYPMSVIAGSMLAVYVIIVPQPIKLLRPKLLRLSC